MFESEDFESELEDLMQEPPHGFNHGVKNRGTSLECDGVFGFRVNGGWTIVWPGNGGTKGNRHVLAEDEYVDEDVLALEIEDRLGHSLEDVKAAYSQRGRITPEHKVVRDDIDAKILSLYEAGANMFQFALYVGMNQRTMNRAIVKGMWIVTCILCHIRQMRSETTQTSAGPVCMTCVQQRKES